MDLLDNPRIQKLLEMVANNPNIPESHAAVLKLQSQFLTLVPWPQEPEPVTMDVVAQDLTLWSQRLIQVVAPNFRTVASANYSEDLVWFMGHTNDRRLAEAVLHCCRRGALKQGGVWWAAHPEYSMQGLEDFLHGWVVRLGEELNAQVALQEYGPKLVPCFAVPIEIPTWEVDVIINHEEAYAAGRMA